MGNEIVFRRKQYVLIKKRDYYMVVNTYKEFSDGHTHIQSKDVGVIMIKNLVEGKLPETRNVHLLESYLRVASDKKYKQQIIRLIDNISLGLI